MPTVVPSGSRNRSAGAVLPGSTIASTASPEEVVVLASLGGLGLRLSEVFEVPASAGEVAG